MEEEKIDYVDKALFVATPDNEPALQALRDSRPDVEILVASSEEFLSEAYSLDPAVENIVVCARLGLLKQLIDAGLRHEVALGILPMKEQKALCRFLGLSATEPDQQYALALRRNPAAIDLIRCNGHLVLYNARIGNIALSQSAEGHSRLRLLRRFFADLRHIRMIGFRFSFDDRKPIETAASGCVIVMHHAGSLAARVVGLDTQTRDGMISMLVAAPASVMSYLSFVYRFLRGDVSLRNLPDTLGYIKSARVRIDTSEPLPVDIDGYEAVTETPAECTVQALALRVNRLAGEAPETPGAERYDTRNLPMGPERAKAMKKKLPFFSYATEERFRDLFLALRQDARSSKGFVVLMILSTLLATVGLFQDSASVIIGAMLLAPLMAPIVALGMGLLRSDQSLYYQSTKTIALGVVIALCASVLMTLVLPTQLVTAEMSARLNPSLMDLAVAILAGIAAAYTKAHREMLSGLAGVAIAVALVPPLAVAGIGLGRFDLVFFSQAFLLFSTNLVGIIVTAAITFRVLGYSPAIQARKSFFYVIVTLALISLPLYLSYDEIVEGIQTEQAWKKERFLVNGKYLIVRNTRQYRQRDQDVLEMEIYARDTLTRADLDAFKATVRQFFEQKLLIRARVTYIL